MMKRSLYILLLLTSCQKAPFDFMVKEGSDITERRVLSSFDTLIVEDIFDIRLIEDSVFFADVTAGENIMRYVKTAVNGKTITLDNTIKGRWSRPYHHPQIDLHVGNLSYIRLNEACNLTSSDSINCDRLYFYASTELSSIDLCLKGLYFDFANLYSGSGHCTFRGKLKQANLFAGGTTIVDASELEVDSAIIFQNSVADMKVWVTKNIIELRIFKNGKLYIKGNPALVHYYHPSDSVNVTFVGN
jgi:hypothetical protein